MDLLLIKLFIILFLIVILLDFIWLGFIVKSFNQKGLSDLLSEKFKIIPALLVYILLSLGMIIFVLKNPNIQTIKQSILFGALFGFVVYGVYEFTNYSILRAWSLKVVLVDLFWGSFLGAVLGGLGKFLILKFS